MITNENCGLSLQLTCLLVNLSTRQLTQGISRISRPSLWGRGRGRGQLGLLVCFVVLLFCCFVVLLFCCFVVLLLCCFVVLLFCIFSFYNKLSPNIAFLISFSCSNTKRATIALNRAVEGSFTLVADFRRSRTPLRSESM